jgi:hypothetical protein
MSSDQAGVQNPSQKIDCRALSDQSKKRPRTEVRSGNTKTAMGLSTIRKLRLEAIFYPKFENEKSNQDIRTKMLELVATGKGYLEVTLKHSGSLILWSGGQRYYSKNSTSNLFTMVAEILMRQHMERAWRNAQGIGKAKYEELSRYLEDHRLTLAFEVVTAVMGDHGDIPKKDFLIVTAVADRSKERFLSTAEELNLCQQFRLPHNDAWAFTSGAGDLFKLYDSCRETGLATDTIQALSESAQAHVASMYPHTIFQGEILEGFIIRYVAYPQVDQSVSIQQQIQSLAAKADHILEEVPPSLPASYEIAGPESVLFNTDIRKVFEEVGGPELGIKAGDAFTQVLETILSAEDGNMRRVTERVSSKGFDLPSITRSLESSDDLETRRIAQMLQTLASLNKSVNYSILEEHIPASKASRTLCIITVVHDETFLKYQNVKNPDTMDLFRGFSIELATDELPVGHDADTVAMECEEVKGGTPSLMLKMKLLPYMIRTFICRNKLNVIQQDGTVSFVAHSRKLLKTWAISAEAASKYLPFLEQWAIYAKGQLQGVPAAEGMPRLSEFSYLKHFEHFQTLYEKGLANVDNTKESFQGFVYVAALKEDTAEKGANEIAKSLVRPNVSSLKDAMQGFRRRGVVCFGTVDSYGGATRRFLGDFQAYSVTVLIGCSEEEIESEFSGDENVKIRKRFNALCQRWKEVPSQSCVSLPISIGDVDGCPSHVDYSIAVEVINQATGCAARNETDQDTRPGLLVFFPGLPGCGKSSLVGSNQNELRERISTSTSDTDKPRNVDVLVGDEHGKSFWNLVKKVRLKNAPSSVTIIDKNTPPPSWSIVGNMCSGTSAVPVAVFPDSLSLRTTRIVGMRKPDGTFDREKSHFYPFSLEYLAVCVAHVLQRPASTHIGKLDRGTRIAAMVVVMFYGFYRYLSAEALREDIDRKLKVAGALNSLEPIQVPILVDENNEFPRELLATLEEAIQLVVRYTSVTHDSDFLRYF